MRIEKAIYNHIEFELSMYYENKKVLEAELERILDESPYMDGQPRATSISNPTQSKAIRRMTSVGILTLEKTVGAIGKVINSLPEHYKKLFEEYYIKQRKNIIELSNEMHISKETFYRYKKEIIFSVACELGWINCNVTKI